MIVTFVFYNKSYGKQAKLAFSKELVHSNIVIDNGKSLTMLMFERSGLIIRPVYRKAGASVIKELIKLLPKNDKVSAIVNIEIHFRKKFLWFPWWARTCNEVCRYGSGIDIGFTFNPRHLYSKLLKYNGKRNYEIISQWRRSDELSIRQSRGRDTGSATKV